MTYRQRYSRPKTEGEFRILDNGVAEGVTTDILTLIKCSQKIQADELVIPDVMCHYKATIEAGRAFMKTAAKFLRPLLLQAPQLAAVVQGRNSVEWTACVVDYLTDFHFERVTTLMFPRCMNLQSLTARYEFLKQMFEAPWWLDLTKDRPVQIHCLGACQWVQEVKSLSELAPIRSMDTCLPIALGLEGLRVERGAYVKRQADYFGIKYVDEYLQEVIRDNCRVYRGWARDETQTPIGTV